MLPLHQEKRRLARSTHCSIVFTCATSYSTHTRFRAKHRQEEEAARKRQAVAEEEAKQASRKQLAAKAAEGFERQRLLQKHKKEKEAEALALQEEEVRLNLTNAVCSAGLSSVCVYVYVCV